MMSKQKILTISAITGLTSSIAALILSVFGDHQITETILARTTLTQKLTFSSHHSHPINDISGPFEPLYSLSIEVPTEVLVTDDIEVFITLETLSSYLGIKRGTDAIPAINEGNLVSLKLLSEAMKTTPNGEQKYPWQ